MNKRFALLLAASLAGSAAVAFGESGLQRELKLSPGGELRVDVDLGAVTVRGSAEPDARVVVHSRHEPLEDLLTVKLEESPGLVRVTARKRHRFSWFDFRNSSV